MVSKGIVCWFWLCIQYCWSLSAVLSTVFVFCLCVFAPTTVFVFLPQQQGRSPYPTVHTELFIHSLGGQMAGGHTKHYHRYQHCHHHCRQRYHHYSHLQTILGTVTGNHTQLYRHCHHHCRRRYHHYTHVHTLLGMVTSGHTKLDKVPRLSIIIVIWILSSDTHYLSAQPIQYK